MKSQQQPIPFELRSCKLTGISLIEASAGTGKTFTISRLFLRLVLEGWNIQSILVVTFTEAATRELRRRIRKALRECAEALANLPAATLAEADGNWGQNFDDLFSSLQGNATSPAVSSPSISQLVARLKRALSDFNEASIFTIHAFCNRILREYPFESDSFFEFEILPDDSQLLEEIVFDFWRQEICQAPIHVVRFAEMFALTPLSWCDIVKAARTKQSLRLTHKGKKLDAAILSAFFEEDFRKLQLQWSSLRISLQALLESWESDPHPSPRAKWKESDSRQLLQILDRYFYHQPQEIANTQEITNTQEIANTNAGNEAAGSEANAGANVGINRQKKAGSLFNLEEIKLLQRFQALLSADEQMNKKEIEGREKKGESRQKKTAAKRQKEMISFKLAWGHFWRRYQQIMTALMGHLIFLTEKLLANYPERLRQLQERQRQLSYNDLIIKLHRVLMNREKGGPLLTSLRQRYRAALIDEFQDTDALQWDILRSIFSPNGRSHKPPLFLVGDPKQSIYAFRGANLEVYLAARQVVDQHFYLKQNYRATSILTTGINALFHFSSGSPFLHPLIEYIPISAAAESPAPHPLFLEHKNNRETGEALSTSPIQCFISTEQFHAGQSQKEKKEQKDMKSARAAATETVCGEIVGLLRLGRELGGDKVLQPKEIAVLVRTHDEAREMQQALQERGVAAVLYSKENIFQSQEAKDLETILEALLVGGSAQNMKRILATEIFGYSAEEIINLSEERNEWEKLELRFTEYRELWHKQSFIAMFQSLVTKERLGEKILKRKNGERAFTNLMHLAELIHQNEESSVHGTLRFLKNKGNSALASYNFEELRLESDEEALQIITIHASKGLEFPVVFCPYLWRSQYASTISRRDLLYYDHKQEIYEIMPLFLKNWLTKFPAEERELLSEPQLKLVRSRVENELLAEELRLLYVALTRASQRLYLFWEDHRDSWKTGLAHLLLKREEAAKERGKGKRKDREDGEKRENGKGRESRESREDGEDGKDRGGREGREKRTIDRGGIREALRKLARGNPQAIALLPTEESWQEEESERPFLPSDDRSAKLKPRNFDRKIEAERAIWSFSALRKASEESDMFTSFAPAYLSAKEELLFMHQEAPAEAQREGVKGVEMEGVEREGVGREGVERKNMENGVGENWNDRGDFTSIHHFPRGIKAGLFFHELIEKIAAAPVSNPLSISANPLCKKLVSQLLSRYSFPAAWEETVLKTLGKAWTTPLMKKRGGFSLEHISKERSITELEFHYFLGARPASHNLSNHDPPIHNLPNHNLPNHGLTDSNDSFYTKPSPAKILPAEIEALWNSSRFHISDGYVRGFIDLIFEHQGSFFLVDWKSNWLGADGSDYSAEKIAIDMRRNYYNLQYYIYMDALDRLLERQIYNYSFEKNFGGIFYVYLRGVNSQQGNGIYYDRPNLQSLHAFRSAYLSSATEHIPTLL